MCPSSHQDRTEDVHSKRRRFLQAVGVGGLAGVAGCFGSDDGDDDDTNGEPSGEFTVSNLDPVDPELDAGTALDVSATITNTSDEEATQIVNYRIDSDSLADEGITLDGGDETTVTFEDVAVDDIGGGGHTHGIYNTVASGGAHTPRSRMTIRQRFSSLRTRSLTMTQA